MRQLDRRTGASGDLVFSGIAPASDQVLGHFDVTLHAQAVADHETLVLAIAVAHDAHPALGYGESFSMPMERLEARDTGSKPLPRDRIVGDFDFSPADFLDRIAPNASAQCFRNQLSTEAVPQSRNVVIYRLPDQPQQRWNPRQIVVDAHGSAHEHQTGELLRIGWYRLTLIQSDEPPGYVPLVEIRGKISRPFRG